MSLSATLSSALTGLTATSRGAELVSSNVANALTPGYARRGLALSALQVGGAGSGVRVAGITRDVDLRLLTERRNAQAQADGRETRASFLSAIEARLGVSGDEGSLEARIAAFDTALLDAASRPETQQRLGAALTAAQQLVAHLGSSAAAIQSAREGADRSIAAQVDLLNTSLQRVQDLNIQIRANSASERDTSALMDLRQQEIDRIASIVPLREVDRGNGVVALYATGGAVLVDGQAASFGFSPVGTITPDMTLASGALSGLTLNGRSIDPGDTGVIAGGTLSAEFALRDNQAPDAQAQLDMLARDLVERFADPALDATRASGDPGLFTDAGAAFDPADAVGLAQRLAVNAVVDPARGGAVWRLRDGLGAAAPGGLATSVLLSDMHDALNQSRPAPDGSGARSFATLASDTVASISRRRLDAEAQATFASSRASALHEQEMAKGIDTDQEMQQLLLIEQAYAANARVIQAVEEMMKALMSM